MDRLLSAGIIEARGHEKFSIVAENLEPGPLQTMYAIIAKVSIIAGESLIVFTVSRV